MRRWKIFARSTVKIRVSDSDSVQRLKERSIYKITRFLRCGEAESAHIIYGHLSRTMARPPTFDFLLAVLNDSGAFRQVVRRDLRFWKLHQPACNHLACRIRFIHKE